MSKLEGLIGAPGEGHAKGEEVEEGFQRSIEGYPLAQAFFTYRGSTYTRGFGRMILERIMGEYWNRHFGSMTVFCALLSVPTFVIMEPDGEPDPEPDGEPEPEPERSRSRSRRRARSACCACGKQKAMLHFKDMEDKFWCFSCWRRSQCGLNLGNGLRIWSDLRDRGYLYDKHGNVAEPVQDQ